MNEQIAIDIIYALLVAIPWVFLGPIAVYFISQTLRYRLRGIKWVYLISFLTGIVSSVFILLERDETGEAVISESAITAVLAQIIILTVTIVVSMEGKVWKRILITLLSLDAVSDIREILSSLKEQFFIGGVTDNRLTALTVFLITEIMIMAFELIFFAMIAKMRRKKDEEALPIPVLAGLSLILNIATGIGFDDHGNTEFLSAFRPFFILLSLCALAFVFLLFYIRTTKKERDDYIALNRANEELIESEARYFEAAAKSDTEVRAMRHDMKNNIQVLMLLLENKEYDKMRDYLDELGAGLSVTEVSAHTGDTIADAIIMKKREEARAAGAVLNSSGVISGVDISPADMCKILANLLDNAIEAVSGMDIEGDLKVIDLDFRKTDNFFMISVSNPTEHEVVFKDGNIETIKSDKKSHGFGIKNIRSAASVYGGELSMKCTAKPYGYLFESQILFPLN